MFDMGFLELLMIGVIALLVFGPDKLPGVARSAGLWVGRIKRFVGTVKADIDKELRLQELQEQIQQSETKNSVYEFLNEARNTLNQKVGAEDTPPTPPPNTDPAQPTTSAATSGQEKSAAQNNKPPQSYSAVNTASAAHTSPTPAAAETPSKSNANAAASDSNQH